ncbi:MAG: protein translocase subunit SecD [bacterium]|nr:protein translocase subunit SecD [bacterium]
MLNFTRWQTIMILLLSLLGITFAMPNLVSKMQSWSDPLPNKSLHLGLDLQGGSHLLLEMNSNEIKESWLDTIRGDALSKLRAARPRIAYSNMVTKKAQGLVQVRIRKPEQYDGAFTLLKTLIQNLQGNVFTGAGTTDLVVERAENGIITLKPTVEALNQRIDSAIGTSIETIRRRIDQLGTTEPNIQRQGRTRILVQVPGFDDPKKLKDVIGKTGKLSFHQVRTDKTAQEAQQTGRPAGTIIVDADPTDTFATAYLLVKRPIVAGEDLVDAQPGFDQQTNEPIVSFRFNSAGARRFGKYTKSHVGEPFAIVIDNGIDDLTNKRDVHVISAPVIREPILGGSGQISGNFTIDGVNELSILLRSGALPATLSIIEERSVGASLGADSVAAGKLASRIGLAGVIIFTLIVYGLFGAFAVVALLVNLFMLVAILSILQATLTLPGIAGIVLTVGMAVDANVLIYERIKEELRAGKTAINAIDTGYSRALGTILDANITTFIAAFILFMLGSGPVRGFAVTLSIGILTSVFTAFVLTRLIITFWLQKKKSKGLVLPL